MPWLRRTGLLLSSGTKWEMEEGENVAVSIGTSAEEVDLIQLQVSLRIDSLPTFGGITVGVGIGVLIIRNQYNYTEYNVSDSRIQNCLE